MAASDNSLETLRRDIDKLDDAIHDLLIRRAELAEEIGAVKRRDGGGRGYLRAGREARIMRRLIARHTGTFPRGAVLRIWREIIAGTLAVEGPQAVAAAPPPAGVSATIYRDMIRDYFGSCTPLTEMASGEAVIDALIAGNASVGLVPDPRAAETGSWWAALARSGEEAPRIVARLPFLAPQPVGDGPCALALALAEPEPSGDDATFVVVENEDAFDDPAGAWICLATELSADGDGVQRLIEIAGFVAPGDPQLDALAPARRIAWLGAAPQPLAWTDAREAVS